MRGKALALVMGVWMMATAAFAGEECQPLDERPIRVEAWISKKHRESYAAMQRELAAMGDTRVVVWEYPAENPSGAVAIGKCVPAFIARHILQKALDYTKGVTHLVHQEFVHPHWAGIGTSLFSENSQRPVSGEQVSRLMDDALSTREFHALYRELTRQEETVRGFGLDVPNPKLMK